MQTYYQPFCFVALVTTILCVLFDTFVSALGWEGNAVHETYDVIHHRFSHLDHIGKLPHLFSVGELHPRERMTPQYPHNFFQHPIYRTAENRRGEANNKAKVFVIHCAPQIKQKETKVPFRTQQTRSSVTALVGNFLQVQCIVENHDKGMPVQPVTCRNDDALAFSYSLCHGDSGGCTNANQKR
jgi:hypothetical protein